MKLNERVTEQVLRPCPFCGHEAKMEFREMDDPNDPNDASVTCSNFECEFGGWWVRPSVWNKRPVEDALGERVEKLEDELHVANGHIDFYEYSIGRLEKEVKHFRGRAEKAEAMVERMAKEIKEQNTTIDVLIKKHSNVQFVNKKLQEKIKRQAERITQLEALYREEIKTKKQEALRERAERAEATIADCFAMFNEVNLLDGETDLRDVVNDVIDLFLFWKTACEMQNQAVELLDGWVERFIEVGDRLTFADSITSGALNKNVIAEWNALVTDWKEKGYTDES